MNEHLNGLDSSPRNVKYSKYIYDDVDNCEIISPRLKLILNFPYANNHFENRGIEDLFCFTLLFLIKFD